MAVQNILPDPNYGRDYAGEESSSSQFKGAGFRSVKLSSDQSIMEDRTNSGRLVQRIHGYHKWTIDIEYNPMTRAEFLPVYSFLLERKTTLTPFYVVLPQHITTIAPFSTISLTNAGNTSLPLSGVDAGEILPMYLFNIVDSNDSNHNKTYMITSVDTATDVITFTPPLAKSVSGGAEVQFATPKIKVIQIGSTQEYSLNSNNLYSFSLKLEEVQ